MFVKAIEDVSRYTRAICTISRNYNEKIVNPGSATLFFVNELGHAITCKHVIEPIINRDQTNKKYGSFVQERDAVGKNKYNKRIKELELAYGYAENVTVQLREVFVDCVGDPSFSFRIITHPKYDLAILIFENFTRLSYDSYAHFAKDTSLKQGKFLCRLGFPFPEFTNYSYNEATDDIEWTDLNKTITPRFPIEGMLTRHLIHEGEIMGLEMSTPGLRGQSGGPLFDENGLVCGMQTATNHLHLGFDMKNFEYKAGGRMIKVTNQPFIHVGHCLHVNVIKAFLSANGIKYYEE